MKKFGQVLALVFALAFGYGLGQHAQDLFATDYPTGGAGGGTHPVNLASDVTGELPHGETSDDASQVHGLGSGINVLGNLDASGEFVQRAIISTASPGADDQTIQTRSDTVTFGTAFSGAPKVMSGGTATDNVHNMTGPYAISTTGFKMRVWAGESTTRATGWVALGN